MPSRTNLGLLALAFFVCGHPFTARAQQNRALEQPAIKSAGKYISPSGSCTAVLKRSDLGGFLVLAVQASTTKSTMVKDVTGIAWTGTNDLIYSTSPVYGNPGLYLYDCGSSRSKRILGPHTADKAYPKGADYFELRGLSNEDPPLVLFYYGADVDSIDFNQFRKPDNLYQVKLDGNGFEKAH